MRDGGILIVAPVGRDAALAQEVLQRAAIPVVVCADLDHLSRELAAGAGGVLLTQEALPSPAAAAPLRAALAAQPPWSDLPLIIFVSNEAATAIDALLGAQANATLLERPVRMATLVSVVRVALRARQRQYDLRDHLQARVAAEETARQARTEAEAAVRIRDEVLAAVAHDLKNPLGAIKGYAQLLQRLVARSGTPEVATLGQGLATIDDMVGKAIVQIDELLDLARLQAGQILPLDLRPTDLVALATRVAQDYQQTTARHQIRVESQASKLVGAWDTIRLERVLGNLLSNAIKYSPTGGEIVLAVGLEEHSQDARRPEERSQGECSSEERSPERWATLTMRDQGIGIPPDDLPHIFERFYRARNAASRVPGTGLGLVGARQIVEQHGGTMGIASVEGSGTTVTVRLPLSQTACIASSGVTGWGYTNAIPQIPQRTCGSDHDTDVSPSQRDR